MIKKTKQCLFSFFFITFEFQIKVVISSKINVDLSCNLQSIFTASEQPYRASINQLGTYRHFAPLFGGQTGH